MGMADRRAGGRSRLLPVQLAAILLGILGMHALVQHCPTPSHVMAASDHAAHHGAAASTQTVRMLASEMGAVHPDGGGSMGAMAMLCAAMLLGVGGALVLLLRARPRAGLGLIPRTPAPPPFRSIPDGARAGPPPSLAFSVIRC